VLVLGGGKIGGIIVELLHTSGDYDVAMADASPQMLTHAPAGVETHEIDVRDTAALSALAQGATCVVSALPFFLNATVAAVAVDVGAHYLDLTEDVATTAAVRAIAEGTPVALIPQCGLAPGFISIVAHSLTKSFDTLTDVRMRVGALPTYPANGLKYNLTWSTDGLINEYCNPCEAVREGVRGEVLPLEGLEHFSLDGIDYEAFNTSGGLGTLGDTLEGSARSVDYKTVRYPGHRDAMKLLLDDLRLRDRRDLLKEILEDAVPITFQDVVLIFVTVTGMRAGRFTQETYAKKVYATTLNGQVVSAIQITTASGMCGMIDLLLAGKLPQSGFVRQEDATLDDFISNRFGRAYA
jgi:saccharopine dehydrogenase-like NADP-dependent oxidoreductase